MNDRRSEDATLDPTKFPLDPVLIVDDEMDAIQGCELVLRSRGVNHILLRRDPREVMPLLEETSVSVVLLDLSMPHLSGEELLSRIHETHPEVPVIILTGASEVDTSVRCMKGGASDYMVKPVEESRLVSGVMHAIELRELRQEYSAFRSRVISNALEHPDAFSRIITKDPKMRSLFQYAETVASSSRPVLITGETGVGKELVARALHQLSGRKGAFVAVNVAGLDDTVFADTLFGHRRGAFTGAEESRPGLIEQAAAGNLFLDEIGDLSPSSQVKLLRLLADREYYPIGSDMAKQTDARILMATNQDLEALKETGRFRMDLYYRLHTHAIHVPPLRERLDDLPLLVDHFLERAATALNKRKPTPPGELIPLLKNYHYPGNVRELESMIYEAVSLHRSGVLSMDCIAAHIDKNRSSRAAAPVSGRSEETPFSGLEALPTVKEAQRLLISEALRRAEGNQTLAARLLGLSQSGLSKALKRAREEGERGR